MAKTCLEKQFVQLAGEFGVVSELCRRSIQASLTYGNSKSADIFVISESGSRAAKIEVKSAQVYSWIVGKQAEAVAPHIVWVFAHFPPPPMTFTPAQYGEIAKASPRFHVLTSVEVEKIYRKKLAAAQSAGPRKGQGSRLADMPAEIVAADATAEAAKPPMIVFSRSDVEDHYGKWEKVGAALKAASR